MCHSRPAHMRYPRLLRAGRYAAPIAVAINTRPAIHNSDVGACPLGAVVLPPERSYAA